MIEERRQDVCEHLEDPDDEDAHNHPLPYLLRQGRFHDLPEEEAERRNDGHHDDGRPDYEAFAKHAFVHGPPPGSAQPTKDSSYTHSYPASRSRATHRARWPRREKASR